VLSVYVQNVLLDETFVEVKARVDSISYFRMSAIKRHRVSYVEYWIVFQQRTEPCDYNGNSFSRFKGTIEGLCNDAHQTGLFKSYPSRLRSFV